MTTIAYIVLAHRYPGQLCRLLNALHREGVFFFLCLDKKSDLREFQRALPSTLPVHWVQPRHDQSWGSVGLVRGTMEGLHAVMSTCRPRPDRIVQLSGQCYPIKPAEEAARFFSSIPGKSIIECNPLPFYKLHGGGWHRLQKYHYHIPRWLPFDHARREYPVDVPPRSLKERLLNAAFARKFPMPRRFPLDVVHYAGPQWWAITPDLAQLFLDFDRAHPEVLAFHRHTLIADELYFSTIVGNTPGWTDKILPIPLHFGDWTQPKRPATLTMDYAERIRKAPMLYARKFDASVDSQILDWIDRNILQT